jgi:carboxylate-amine ligase
MHVGRAAARDRHFGRGLAGIPIVSRMMSEKIIFTANRRPTLGVEIELGLIDAQTMALRSGIGPLLERLPEPVRPWVKPELMQCYVEIITDVCGDVPQVERDLRAKVQAVERVCDELGMRLWWGATHPFSRWADQQVTPNQRYERLLDLLQDMARQLVTFGLHVHVGVDSGDKAVMICDRIMQHLPTLLALTANSPFWEGRCTGLKSYRSKVMEGLPTAGLPSLMRNWSEYVWLVNHLVETGFIHSIREIWWDVRPHHNFGTVEVRVCDMPPRLDDVLAIVALVQCLVKALSDRIDAGTYQHDCHPMMVRQNKWRAARYGTQAELVDSYTYELRSVSQAVAALVDRLRPVADALNCREYLERTLPMAREPNGAEVQLQLVRQLGSAEAMVRHLTDQTRLSPPPS